MSGMWSPLMYSPRRAKVTAMKNRDKMKQNEDGCEERKSTTLILMNFRMEQEPILLFRFSPTVLLVAIAVPASFSASRSAFGGHHKITHNIHPQ